MRVVIADDTMIVREGLARLLIEGGCEVVGTAATGPELLHVVERSGPDAAVVDIRMPPTFTDEGLAAARELRRRHPRLGVLLLSQHLESHYATELLKARPSGSGTCSRTASPRSPCSSTRCGESSTASA